MLSIYRIIKRQELGCLKIAMLRDVTPYEPVESYRRFEGFYSLHIHGEAVQTRGLVSFRTSASVDQSTRRNTFLKIIPRQGRCDNLKSL